MDDREQIENRLRSELHEARRRFESATGDFGAVTASVPSGIPFPDNVTRLQQAGCERHAAMRELREALRRWNEFVIDGKLPEDG